MLKKDGASDKKAGPGNPMPETWARTSEGTGHRQIGRTNIAKMTTLPKAIYRSSAVPSKIPRMLFPELEQNFENLYGKKKRPRIAKAMLRKNSKAGGITLPEIRLYDKATGSKQCGTGIKTDRQVNGREQSTQ